MEQYELEVIPGLTSLTDDHPAVLNAVDELTSMLRNEPVVVAESPPPSGGRTKGTLPDILLQLGGSSVAVGAVTRIFRLWLQRDRRRSIVLRRTLADGSVIEREVSGVTISDQTLRTALEHFNEVPPSASSVSPSDNQ